MTRITFVGRESELSWFRNSLHNLLTAVSLRVFQRDVDGVWVDISSTPHQPGIYNILLTYFPLECDELNPLTYDDFINTYKGMRKIRYSNAKSSLEMLPLNSKDASCKCFLKKEKDIRSDKPLAIPRVITFPDPRYGLSVGIYIKSAEESIYHLLDTMWGGQTVMKGKNYASIGRCVQIAWEKYTCPYAMDGDVSRLDSSISDEALLFTHEILSRFFPAEHRGLLKEILSWQVSPQVSGRAKDGGITYKLEGLASGQMNTSLVGVLVVCSILFHYKIVSGKDFSLINCGDDFTVIGERSDVYRISADLSEHFAKFNMVLKTDPVVDTIEKINFCQTSPVFDGVAYRMVRNPWNSFVKDACSETPITTKPHLSRWLRSVGEGGLATHGDMPLFRSLYSCYLRSSETLRKSISTRSGTKRAKYACKLSGSLRVFGQDMYVVQREPLDSVRYSFFLAFDISIGDQRSIEEHYNNLLICQETCAHHHHDAQPWFKLGL
jgi:hypothetical protein